jgi:hypothetical protein
VLQSFWSRVREGAGCWEWTPGSRTLHGTIYLGLGADGRIINEGPHRFSYQIHVGPIPPGLFVCHHCDNKRCVRPDHLYVGTTQDNTRDAIRRNRRNLMPRMGVDRDLAGKMKAEFHPLSRLSTEQVEHIRRTYRRGATTHRALAEKYNVSRTCITDILSGRRWVE